MGVILSVANQKGGVGKTTTTAVLAWLLSKQYRVLCIDLDMQANLTSMLTLTDSDAFKNHHVLHVLQTGKLTNCVMRIEKKKPLLKRLFSEKETGHLDLIPSHESLALYQADHGYHALENALASIRDQYDYIFIDTPPSLDHFLITALVACDYVIGMAQTHPFAIEGIQRFMKQVQDLRAYKPQLKMAGIVVAMFEQTKFNRQIKDALTETYSDLVFQTTILKRNRLMEMTATGITDAKAPDRRALEQYKELAEEIVNYVRQHNE